MFIGSCGRPDLVGSIGFSAEHMASLMFNTLTSKICTLPDDVQVGGEVGVASGWSSGVWVWCVGGAVVK